MLRNFFRKELNLEKKWWHRALLSLYFISFVLTIVVISFASFTEEKKYVKDEPVSNYFTQNPTKLSKIISNAGKSESMVGESDYFSKYGNSELNTYKNIVFCGTSIESNLDTYTSGGKKIDRFMTKDEDGFRELASKEELSSLLKTENINCIAIDSYGEIDLYGDKEYFIEPSRFAEELWFYEYSFLMTLLNCLKLIAYAIIIFIAISIFYYKVLIYIFYGKSPSNIS